MSTYLDTPPRTITAALSDLTAKAIADYRRKIRARARRTARESRFTSQVGVPVMVPTPLIDTPMQRSLNRILNKY